MCREVGRSRDRHQPVDPLRGAKCRTDGDQCAQAGAEEPEPVVVQAVHHRQDVLDGTGQGEAGAASGTADTAIVQDDHSEVAAEQPGQAAPDSSGRAHSGDEGNWLAVAALGSGDRSVGAVDDYGLHRLPRLELFWRSRRFEVLTIISLRQVEARELAVRRIGDSVQRSRLKQVVGESRSS